MDYIKYIPNEMKQIKEYQEIDKAVNPTFISVRDDMASISSNHFLSELDEDGCKRMEKIMNIENADTLSLEARRLLIISKANNTLPYTLNNLKSKIMSLLGNDDFSMDMNYSDYHLSITLLVVNFLKVQYVKENIEGMIPCNIRLTIYAKFNNYGVFKGKYSYKELNSFTHYDMKTKYFGG